MIRLWTMPAVVAATAAIAFGACDCDPGYKCPKDVDNEIVSTIEITYQVDDVYNLREDLGVGDSTELYSCDENEIGDGKKLRTATLDDDDTDEYMVVVDGSSETYYKVHKTVVESSSTYTHKPLLELYTGANCPPCVAADEEVEAIEAQRGESVSIVVWHMSIPSYDEWSIDETNGTGNGDEVEWVREVGYLPNDCCFTPFMIVDGTNAAAYTTIADEVTTAVGKSSPYSIQVHPYLNTVTGSLEIVTTIHSSSAAANLRLNFAVIQDAVANKSSYYTYTAGITTFNDVAREAFMTGSTQGALISLEAGRNVFNHTMTMNTAWYSQTLTPSNLQVVAYLQEEVAPGSASDGTGDYGGRVVKTRNVSATSIGHATVGLD